MADVTPLRANELDALFKELGRCARAGEVTWCYCILQTESSEEPNVVRIAIEEAGERSDDPDHLIALIGHHIYASNSLTRDVEESILDGTE